MTFFISGAKKLGASHSLCLISSSVYYWLVRNQNLNPCFRLNFPCNDPWLASILVNVQAYTLTLSTPWLPCRWGLGNTPKSYKVNFLLKTLKSFFFTSSNLFIRVTNLATSVWSDVGKFFNHAFSWKKSEISEPVVCLLDIRAILRPISFQREVISIVNAGKTGVFMVIVSKIFYCDSANIRMRYVYTKLFYFHHKNRHICARDTKQNASCNFRYHLMQ